MAGTEIELKGLSVGYPGRTLVSGMDAVFPAGSLTALVGRNGTGKSTLLRVVAGLVRPLAGEVIFRDSGGDAALSSEIVRSFTDVSARSFASLAKPAHSQFSRRRCISAAPTKSSGPSARELARTVGFVSTERIRVTNLRVRDVVALGRTPYTDWLGRSTQTDDAAIDGALEQVGMSGFAAEQMDTLSDGEAQRVMIARVLAQDTPVILLDEPTAFLDFYARREVCELLARLACAEGKTVVFSSHELDLVHEFADRQIEISDRGVDFREFHGHGKPGNFPQF